MKKAVLVFVILFLFIINVKAIEEVTVEERVDYVTNETTEQTQVDPDTIIITEEQLTTEEVIPETIVDSTVQESSSINKGVDLLNDIVVDKTPLYIVIGAVSLFVLFIIGVIGSKIENKHKNNPKNML